MYLLLTLTGVEYFYEEFNSLNGWRTTGGGWRIDSSAPLPPPGDGIFTITRGDNSPVRDTLISPSVALVPSPTSLYLTFSYSLGSIGGDSGIVLVRYFSSGSWGGWTVVRVYDSTSSGRDTVPLSAAADSVALAFLYVSSGSGLYFAVDDVLLYGEVDFGRDWEAAGIETPEYWYEDSTFTVVYRVRNNGSTTDTATVIYGVLTYVSDTLSLILPPGGDTLIPLTLSVHTAGYTNLYLIVASPYDTFGRNDTLVRSVRIYPRPVRDLVSFPVSLAPLVDGLVHSGTSYLSPWDSAGKVPASAWMDGAPVGSCTLLTVNTLTAVYFALVLSADPDPDPQDLILMAVDDDGDGTWASDSSEGWNLIYPNGWYTTPMPGSVPPSLRTDLGTALSFHYDPTIAYRIQAEWRLNCGNEPDPASLPCDGDTIRISILYRSGEDNRVVCRWPQDSDPSSPSTFGRLVLRRPVGVEERVERVDKGKAKVYDVSGRFVGYTLRELPTGVYFLVEGRKVRRVVVR